MWYLDSLNQRLHNINTTLTYIGNVSLSVNGGNIIYGPDGAMWFTENSGAKIGRYDYATGGFTDYALPPSCCAPNDLTIGPDGNIWFTDPGGNKVGYLTPSGFFTSVEYPATTLDSGPTGITTGPDGALWFTEQTANKIGRISTSGSMTEYPVPTVNGLPQYIAPGPDGNLWFTELSANKIGVLAY